VAQTAGNQTPNTPDVSETKLREQTVDDLREAAREAGVSGVSDMRKDELVEAVAQAQQDSAQAASDDVGAGPDEGRLRTGSQTSDSLKYSQEVTSPDEDAERPGRSLATTHHEVIKQWAEERGGTPATVEGTEHGDHLGVLRFDFGGDNDKLRHVSWDEWFATFDARRLNFIYQDERSDGSQSNFFRLESPDREDG
jgi:Rho termination factor, N-terminal domain